MFTPYIDLHTHTTNSDGRLTPIELVEQARNAGIRILSITDHNYTEPLDSLRRRFPDMTLIQGAELSCVYEDSTGKEHELHVVALGFDPDNPDMKTLLAHNRPDRRPYINAILDRLRDNGIDLGTYEDIQARFPQTEFVGRMALAKTLFDEGYTSSVDESFEIYLGAHGQRRAFVENHLKYASLAETVETIMGAGGVPVLAHLFYYVMNDAENERLVSYFKCLTGNRGAMEVYYNRYPAEVRLSLLQLCRKYDLMPSAASDYHGQEAWERLDTCFCYTTCAEILDCLGIRVDAPIPGELLLLSGFSGAGKGTICRQLYAVRGKPVCVIRSVTTRPPRPEGDAYTYVSADTFRKMIDERQLLEHNFSYGNGYGTPIEDVQRVMNAGMIPCLEIDRTGLIRLLTDGRIDPRLIRAVYVAATAEDLVSRLRGRGTENPDAIRSRLEIAMEDTRYLHLYDAVIVNKDLDTAIEDVTRAFEGHVVSSDFDVEGFCSEILDIMKEM